MNTRSFALLAALAALCAHLCAAEGKRPDLLGQVAQPDGAPVTNATVFIYTAGPKVGTGVICPSCYPDCNKKASTDATGRFKIEALDPALLFRLLVVAPGYENRFVNKVNPAVPQNCIELKRLSPEKLKSRTRIVGMVMDANGQPLVGATIDPNGVETGDGTTRWGGCERYVDPLAITDDHGCFLLFCTNGVTTVHAVAEGRGVAKRWVQLKPGGDHLVRMEEGATVTGRIVRNGQPVAGAAVGAATVERTAGLFFTCEDVATDPKGVFVLPNVPPDRDFVLYCKMDSVKAGGVTPGRTFNSGGTGGTVNLGDLRVVAGHRLAGRVVLTDGKPLPANTRLYLGREQAWDHAEVVLDKQGRFEFKNVPAESVGLHVRLKGYKMSKRNPSLDWLNGGIVGRVTGDLDNLVLLMEPGEWRLNGDEGEPPGGERQPRNQPLRGAKF